MWVEGGDIHDELLDQLGAVLTAPEDLALAPSAVELEALAAAVADRWPEGAAAPAGGGGRVPHLRPTGQRPLRRLGSRAWRAGSVAAGLVVFSGSAAAAAGGVPLPRPVRVVAYTVGFPVDSPALDDTNQHIEQLKEAAKANDKPKVEATARRLETDLKKVPSHEKKEAKQKVEAAMAIVAPLIAPTTTTTAAPTPPTTVAPAPPPPTTSTTAEAKESGKDKNKNRGKDKNKEKGTVTPTTERPTTTTTAPESTTSTTAPETDETPSDGTPSGDPGTGTGDPGTGDPGTGGGDEGSTTPTTTPDGGTTTTTIPDGGGAPGGGDPGSTTTTTSSTTTTTMPPANPGTGTQP